MCIRTESYALLYLSAVMRAGALAGITRARVTRSKSARLDGPLAATHLPPTFHADASALAVSTNSAVPALDSSGVFDATRNITACIAALDASHAAARAVSAAWNQWGKFSLLHR